MEITEVKIFPVQEEKLKAFVSIVLDGCFMINDIKIIRGKDGLFISMPSRRKKNGRFKDIAHPLNNETRQWMEAGIVGEYERVIAGDGQPRGTVKAAVAAPPATPAAAPPSVSVTEPPAPIAPEPTAARSAPPTDPPSAEPRPPERRPAGPPPAPRTESAAAPSPTPSPTRDADPTATADGEPAGEAEAGPEPKRDDEKTLEEVAEAHLTDSYWTS